MDEQPRHSRRKLIVQSSSVFLTGSLGTVAGCTELDTDEESHDQYEGLQRLAEDELPTVDWSESWVKGTDYRVDVEVDLREADRLVIGSSPGESDVAEFHASDGQHHSDTIAGEDTSYGLADATDMFTAAVPGDPVDQTVDTFMVGSQEELPSLPTHLIGLGGNTSPDLDTGGWIDRTFTYEIDGGRHQLSLSIPEMLYEYYSDRVRTNDRGVYVADPYQHPYLDELAEAFEDYGDQLGLSDREVVDYAMAFVQQLEYTRDIVSAGIEQYTTYPMETLFDEEGDCEDTAILLAGILSHMGYDCVLLGFFEEAHMALGVAGEESIPGSYYQHRGKRFYYVETTAPGWGIGEVPPDLEDASAEIQEIRDHPIPVFSWSTMTPAEGGVEVDVRVRNVGDAIAQDVEVGVDFEDRSENVVEQARRSSFTIAPEDEEEVTLTLNPPADVELRAVVGVMVDGVLRDLDESEWRDPEELDP